MLLSLTALQTALEVGAIYSLVALALFISFSILNIADLSTDGCYTLGFAVGATVTLAGHPLLALPAAMAAGACSGFVTAFLQTRLGVESILAGIIVNTGLYTVNLAVMGWSSNLSIYGSDSLFSLAKGLVAADWWAKWHELIVLVIILLVVCVLIVAFSAPGWACPSGPRGTTRTWSGPPPSTPPSPSRWACAWPTPSPVWPDASSAS